MKTNAPRIAILAFTLTSLAVFAWKPTTRTIAGPKLTKPALQRRPLRRVWPKATAISP